MGIFPRTTIIEFNGLPGVGKSTISRHLKEIADKQGIPFYKSYYRYSINKKAISVFLRPDLLRLLPSILRYAIHYKGRLQKYKYVCGILAYARAYLDFIEDVDNGVLVIDQGIIQDFISIAHDVPINNVMMVSSIMRELEKRNIVFFRVDCNLSEDSVLVRLRSRSNGGSRVERYDDSNVLRLLNIQKNNLELVRRELDIHQEAYRICIDASVPAQENARYIWNAIYGQFG